jgi:ribosomal protein L22
MAKTVTVRAYAKGVDQTPRKVSLVAALVRGRTVADALVILNHVPKRAALPVKKAIESAKANATNNHSLDGKTLVITTLSVTTGTRLRRYKPASRGRALPFEKKTSNILVEVSGQEKPKRKPAVKKAEASKEEK